MTVFCVKEVPSIATFIIWILGKVCAYNPVLQNDVK